MGSHMKRPFSALAVACILSLFVTSAARGEGKPVSAMNRAYQDKWVICDRQEPNRTPQQRIEACNYIISLGEAHNASKLVYGGAFYDRGFAYCEQGNWYQGLQDLDKSIAYSQQRHVYEMILHAIYAARADCHIKAKQFNKAIEDIDASFASWDKTLAHLDKWDRDKYMRVLRGDAAVGQGKYAEAVRYYEEEFKDSPNTQGLAEKLAAARGLEARTAPSPNPPQLTAGISQPPKKQLSQGTDQGRRIALVIGISRYNAVPILPNPERDATLVAETLKRTGFEAVTLVTNLDRNAFTDALRDFALQAENADWALIYYAGHGMEAGGVNYLIPANAKIASDRDLNFEAIPLDQVRNAAGRAKRLRLIVLDACRDNPFANQMKRTLTIASRSTTRGLASVEPEAGTLIVYAAKDGETAADGDGQNSPFTTAFVSNVQKPGLEVRRLFDNVRDDVMDATARKQQPFTYGSLSGRQDFFFLAEK
jgi:tetratricopeptide (TPR) repeat protein